MTTSLSDIVQNTPLRAKMRVLGLCVLIFLSFLVLVVLQYQYWYGQNGYTALSQLQAQVDVQLQQNQIQEAKNARLVADIFDLKNDYTATEEYARLDLGLIKNDEVFVQLSETPIVHVIVPKTEDVNDFAEPLVPPPMDAP